MATNTEKESEDNLLQMVNTQQNSLMTHVKVNNAFSGEIVKLTAGYASVILETIEVMRADELGLVHGGFIFSAADFAAMVAVNEPNVVLASVSCLFLSPVRIGDKVTFVAEEHQKEGRKRTVSVKGYVHEIKVFEGEFKTVITEHHILRLDLLKNIDEGKR
ncbi:MAG: hotdog domain-containing protein [Sulfuricurvum sp.]